MQQILIIDDDVELCELLSEFLGAEKLSITCVHSGSQGLAIAQQQSFDLIILDVMLPEINGLEVLKKLRLTMDTPVIMLTARGDEVDRILGLELGADDYLPKPFSPRELVARIRAVARRSGSSARDNNEQGRVEIDNVCLDPATHVVSKDGVKIGLTEVEFNILDCLMRVAGTVIERQDLAQRVLGRRLTYDDRSLDVHMSNLRKKIGNNAGNYERIKTIRGVGYLYVKPDS